MFGTERTLRLAPSQPGDLLQPPAAGLVGRTRELAEAEGLLAGGARLLLFTGPGGAGKTRLARAVARRAGALKARRTLELDATELRSPYELEARLGAPAPELLLLDGADRLETPVWSELIERMEASPELVVLATSRRRLAIEGARTIVVGPLALEDGVELFLERARAVSVDLGGLGGERAVIAEIVRRVDGSPLAIELAAARLLVLSPRSLLDRLDERFRLLESDRADLPARQRSLAACINESWKELSPDEQRVLEQMAVLGGGLALHEAEVLLALEGSPLIDVLQSLVARSLLVAERAGGGEPRFAIDENVRAFALEFGVMSPEERATLLARSGEVREHNVPRALELDTHRRCFRVGSAPEVNLARRRAPWLVLQALAAARLANPAAPMSVEALALAGWPGEKILPNAAAARVYFVVRELRKRGLEGLLVTVAEGYLLDAAVELTGVDHERRPG